LILNAPYPELTDKPSVLGVSTTVHLWQLEQVGQNYGQHVLTAQKLNSCGKILNLVKLIKKMLKILLPGYRKVSQDNW
jgi:hypothetical protein